MIITAKEVLDFLEKEELTQKQNLRLLGILNKQLNTFPLQDVIKLAVDGGYLANGQKLSTEQLVKFRESLSALRDNPAFQMIGDQILFLAIQHGVHYGDTVDKIMFSKSAIYFITKFRELINTLDVKNQ